ncbi:MAG: LamG domain-containing protein [bacterium]|nr:LamG domain-containing protein [bacterium]
MKKKGNVMQKEKKGLWLIISIIFFYGKMVYGEAIYTLTFDNSTLTPLKREIKVEGKEGVSGSIEISDSVKLVKGLKGLGIYLDNRSEYVSLPDDVYVNPEEGAISFWFRPFWGSGDKRNKIILSVNFDKGCLLLWNMLFCVKDRYDNWSYPPKEAIPSISRWKPGEWHFIVLNWSASAGRRDIVVDGGILRSMPYVPPEGKSKISLSPGYKDISDRVPGCGVYDELVIYDAPLSKEEIEKKYSEGMEILKDVSPDCKLEVLTYPNLASEASLHFSITPNYENNGLSCNNFDDKTEDINDLSDSLWFLAHYSDKRSVGWMSIPVTTLTYDLKGIKNIEYIVINIGGGDSGVRFPKEINFYAGITEEKLSKVGLVCTEEPYPNPEFLKWHSKLVGTGNINVFARFVKIEIVPSCFCDEIFIIEKNAKPFFKSIEIEAE